MKLKIDGKEVTATEGMTILEAARSVGICIPTLCYLKDVNEIGACRVCVVEVKGADRLVAACQTAAEDGMEIETASPRVMAARKRNVELILSNHDCRCPTCSRNGRCPLQSLAQSLGLLTAPAYAEPAMRVTWDPALPLQRNERKCISCLRCVSVCEKVQAMNVWDLLGVGAHTRVGVAGGAKLTEAMCTLCGQCITHCPVSALNERDDTDLYLRAIADPSKTVVVQVAPAVRTAWADSLGLAPERATPRRMAAALKATGADYVFDTCFSADLTIMEEGSEFLEHIKKPDRATFFTSCCPGWVRFMRHAYPDMVGQLSSAKSPQQMFGAVVKNVFAKKIGKDPKDVFSVSIMPCLAKKWEATTMEGVDLVLTTREFERLLLRTGVNLAALEERDFDSPLGTGSGAGVIFGATGGVMEAALRTAAAIAEGKNPDADAFRAVRGTDGRKELTVTLASQTIRACVVSGLGNARRLVEDLRAGRVDYDFVEVMACPGGCVGGGGQPFWDGYEAAAERGAQLYTLDQKNPLRFSHENPEIQALYRDDLGAPLSETAHHLLHTDQTTWAM